MDRIFSNNYKSIMAQYNKFCCIKFLRELLIYMPIWWFKLLVNAIEFQYILPISICLPTICEIKVAQLLIASNVKTMKYLYYFKLL